MFGILAQTVQVLWRKLVTITGNKRKFLLIAFKTALKDKQVKECFSSFVSPVYPPKTGSSLDVGNLLTSWTSFLEQMSE